MPHLRSRHILTELKRLATFWPAIGLLGLRQSGKSTVLRELLEIKNYYTLDDENTQEDVRLSAMNFLEKVGSPVVIDEVQKSGKIFDALKLSIDQKRRPGKYYLSGSSRFSSKLGIRESLTGRIALIHLYPFTLAEDYQKDFKPEFIQPIHRKEVRFKIQDVFKKISSGGLPVPLFTREKENQKRYFRNWLETAVFRDTARVYGRGYDPDVCWSILRQLGGVLREGEYPTLAHFKQDSRILRKYLTALEDIFVLRKLPCHEAGVGKEIWMVTDSGLATEIMETDLGEGATLTLGRIFVLNEILARTEYLGNPVRPLYYKTARGSPVDLIWGDTLIKISNLPKSQLSYDIRPVAGALQKLKFKNAVLAVPRDEASIEKKGISVVPWCYWS